MAESGANTPQVDQRMMVVGGAGYAAINGDVHVLGRKETAYSLRHHQLANNIRSQPELQASLDKLKSWRSGGQLLAVRWLRVPDPAVAANLCSELANESAAAGWNVLWADHPQPGDGKSADQRSFGRATTKPPGVLLIVAAADQWLPSNLTWLFSDSMLHNTGRARLLLAAADDERWPGIRGSLANNQAVTSYQEIDDP